MRTLNCQFKTIGLAAWVVGGLILSGATPSLAMVPDKDTPKVAAEAPSSRIIVKFNEKATSQGKASLHGKLQGKTKGKFESINAEVVEFAGKKSKNELKNIIAQYKKDPNVEFAEEDGIMMIQEGPTMGDPEYIDVDINQLHHPLEETFPQEDPESPIKSRGVGKGPIKKEVTGKEFIQEVQGDQVVEGGIQAISPVYSDPQKPWGLHKIQAQYAWRTEVGTNKVLVAVVDTGVDRYHEDLGYTVVNGYDFYNGDYDSRDDHGHGTHVSGTIAANLNNGKGVAGVSPNVYILSVKVCGATGSCSYSAIANGIIYAANRGAKVINLSLGGGHSYAVQSAVAYAWNKGAVLACAAGNGGARTTTYPARYSQCLAVAATDQSNNRASFSQYAGSYGVAAPGVGIRSTLPGNRYASWSGTSMATPHVAGVAALLFSQDRWHRNNVRVRQLIQVTAIDIGASGRDGIFGYGLINAYRAVNYSAP
jgi:subtilisin family serine protease